MNICPITYEPIVTGGKYSPKGLHRLSTALSTLKDFPYTAAEQRHEAQVFASKLSIQGVQPKISVVLNVKASVFETVARGGRYIVKPQVEQYKQLPENEDLTMRLASAVGIEVPLHGLMHSKGGSFSYFIRRFDRQGQKGKLHTEDFAQLSGASRDTKYNSSMESVAEILNLCTFPAIERLKLFRQTMFSFLVGNEDMHLKNFSLIMRDGKIELSPAYDLVNTTIALAAPKEEMALPVRGRKNNITRNDLVKYFALGQLDISQAACDSMLADFKRALPVWNDLINRSFLSQALKKQYLKIVRERTTRMQIA